MTPVVSVEGSSHAVISAEELLGFSTSRPKIRIASDWVRALAGINRLHNAPARIATNAFIIDKLDQRESLTNLS